MIKLPFIVKKQYLCLPLQFSGIEAGYKHPSYLAYYKYNHLGYDITNYKNRYKSATVVSSGVGQVVAAGLDSGVGNVIAIRYYNVYRKSTGACQDVIARYMHLNEVLVNVGDMVFQGTPIGISGNTGTKGGIHLHIEFDTDTEYPCYSGQISASRNNDRGKIFFGGYGNTMFTPEDVLYLGPNQSSARYKETKTTGASWCTVNEYSLPRVPDEYLFITTSSNDEQDAPEVPEEKPDDKPTGSYQKLILPINTTTVTASMSKEPLNTDPYYQRFKMVHYGIDSYGASTRMFCSGNGEVLAAGNDNVFGNVVIIKYPNCYNHKTGKIQDLIIRHYHLSKISVKTGDKVTINTEMGHYGNTGLYSVGYHLHMEADTDTKHYAYTAGLKSNGTIIKSGTAETIVNPMEFMHLKVSKPECQTIKMDKSKFNGKYYVREEDIKLPEIE